MATPPHPVLTRIHEADRLIIAEAFDPLMDHYTEDAVLILEPGQEVRGRDAIRQAMAKIAAFVSQRAARSAYSRPLPRRWTCR